MKQFMSTSGMDEAPPVEMSPEAQEFLAQQMASMEQNFDFFFRTTCCRSRATRRITPPCKGHRPGWWRVLAKTLWVR